MTSVVKTALYPMKYWTCSGNVIARLGVWVAYRPKHKTGMREYVLVYMRISLASDLS